jgi:integrase
VSGVTRRVTIGRANVLDAATARAKAKTVLANLALGVDPKAGKGAVPTLTDAFKEFIQARSGGLSKGSVTVYSLAVNRYLEPWLKRPMNTITTEMVERRHTELGEVIGHATANSTMRALRLLWNFVLEKNQALGPNPVRLKRRWHDLPVRTRLVKADQLPAFYKAVCGLPNDVHADYLLTLLFTGLRRMECASLRWEHIDFAARTMCIPAQNTKAKRKLDLPLSDFMLDLLVRRRQLGNAGWVFPSNSGAGYLQEPKYALDQVEASCGIRISPHDLRRTFVTVAESCDISLLSLMALVNHSTGKSVTAGYVQLTAERLREPAQKVADRLKELCGVSRPGLETGNVQRMR